MTGTGENVASDDVASARTVAVVIPTFNAAERIAVALDSVMRQTSQPAQVIVVDDGSTDATSDVVARYAGCVRCIRQGNAGPAAARNTGISAASADWIAFLDDDDTWEERRLELSLDLLRANTDLMWCATAYTRMGAAGSVPSLAPLPSGPARLPFFAAALARTPICTPGMMVRRDVLREAGGFCTDLRLGEDIDLWIRIAVRYPTLGFVWTPCVRVGSRAGSITGSAGEHTDSMLFFVRRQLAVYRQQDDETKAMFLPLLQHYAGELTAHALSYGRKDVLVEFTAEGQWLLRPKERFAIRAAHWVPGSWLKAAGATRRRWRGAAGRRDVATHKGHG